MKKLILSLLLTIASLNAQNIELSATVISDNEKYITSRFMGFIKELKVSEGSIVKKGQLLYKIDTTDIDAKKSQAQLQVSMYKTQFEIVNRNYERFQRLYKKGLVSKAKVEELEMNYRNLNDMIEIAKAQLKEVNNQYKYLAIKAPNSGVVTKKMIKVGEMAIPGMPALILTDLSDLKIKAEISEGDLFKIKVGDKVEVQIPSLKYNTIGNITSIIPSSNPMTHTFMIKISFKSTSQVYPGMYAKVNIRLK
ncbi:MAG TPA: efflux RND transporter periplasmic adaptor subunit [Arcobacter sp.]|nr:efflux RND transporter periplasmic adaptor subunit [Arcobacter sp.]HIP56233.1 efflux RND transporter periplasmic adaptor subunit [Arcobacter sp.]